uniref:Uncharacterized protein n=1 Tax=Panagrolaimus davidi TaxID=227884 RepID=A0A914Q3S8_9BILA
MKKNSRNHESRRRQSLPSLTSYSMINTSLTNADELPPPQQPRFSLRKFSADTLDFSSMDYFSSMNLSSSNNVNNHGILAPVKTGATALMPTISGESERGNGDTHGHNRSSAIIKEEDEETDDDLNQGFIVEDKDVDFSNVLSCIRKSIFHRRESLPTFLSINPTTIAASANIEGKSRRNSIDVVRSQKSLQIKKCSTKSNDFLNKAFINDKENDKLEYYDKIVEEEDENEHSDVFEVEEKRYERVLYLPKAVEDSEIDYKKKYEQLLQKYQKREERIADVKKLIMEGKSKKDVLQRLNGILTHQKPVSSVKKVAVEKDTVNVSQIEHPSLFATSSSPEPSDTIDDLEKEFERLKVNMEEENITKVSYKNITEEYLEKFSNEKSQRRSLQAQLNEKNEEIEVLKTQLSAEKENDASVVALKNENEMLKSKLEEINSVQKELIEIIKSCKNDVQILATFKDDLHSFITMKDNEIISLRNNLAIEIKKKEHVKNVVMPMIKNSYNSLKAELAAEKNKNVLFSVLKIENEMLKRNLEEVNSMKNELFKIIESCGDDMKSLTMYNGDLRSFITIENSEIIKLVRLLLQYMSL